MQYPLQERIGNPDLFTGREKELRFAEKWLNFIPKRLAKSRMILARRKSGKTAFVQRIFNNLWNANGDVIPFYFEIAESKVWYPLLAVKYYRAFASQYISFVERDPTLVKSPLSLKKIREYGVKNSISLFVDDVDFLIEENRPHGMHGLMWDTACEAPDRFAAVYDKRFLVILDEFQNLVPFVYPDPDFRTAPIETLPGSFHGLSESKIAPMLVTGSYITLLLDICGKYLQAGRLSHWQINPYLTSDEGLQAVYKYAEHFNEPITNETALQINRLCMSDPFFIACVMQSESENRDLSTQEGVIEAYNYEITDRRSMMTKTWHEYIQLTLQKINDRHAKNMLLYLSKHSDRYYTHRELKEILLIDLDLEVIKKKLLMLVEADVIEWGVSDIDFRGLQDGTLNLILRNRFEKEISGYVPDLRQEACEQIRELQEDKKRLQGKLNNLSGQFAEYQLFMSFRSKKRFALSEYFNGVTDTTRLNITDVKQRITLQRENGKRMELDVTAESDCGRIVAVEVKKLKTPVGKKSVLDFIEKLDVYARQMPDNTILPAFLALGGFREGARKLCELHSIGTAERIAFF